LCFSVKNAVQSQSYVELLNAYVRDEWPNAEFASNWTVKAPHPLVQQHYGLHHWHDHSVFGVDQSVFVGFNPPSHMQPAPNEWIRWAVISFPRRLVGMFELERIDESAEEYEDIEALPNGAFRYAECVFAIHPIPLNWLVAFKSVRWPSIALELASQPMTAEDLLPEDRAYDAESILRRAADEAKERPLFKFKPHQLKPAFHIDEATLLARQRFRF
jgi:hypothetical protein